MRLWGGRMNWDFILVCHEGSEQICPGLTIYGSLNSPACSLRFDHVASFHLDELGASDFYLYMNPPCA